MKYLFFLICFLSITINTLAEDGRLEQPSAYCNVVRNQQSKPVKNKSITVQVSILKASANGSLVYRENHFTSTNFFGAFLVNVGGGIAQIGSFDTINWGTSLYYLKVAVDTNGGSDFGIILPVGLYHIPYALYQKCGAIIKDGEARTGFKHYAGELYGGGVVFDTWKDLQGNEHGLIVSLKNQSDSVAWSNIDTVGVGVDARSICNGDANTHAITTQRGQKSGAAQLCRNYSAGGFSDWYLPSISELNLLYDNRNIIKSNLAKAGEKLATNIYYSSTEYGNAEAWVFATYGGPTNNYIFSKYTTASIRAIRKY